MKRFSYLKNLPSESQAVVSAFHLVEHIPFDQLQVLVQEALRVLKPAGLLILETPNPENLVVGTASFYMDPTHMRPIPSELLAFLPEHYGFFRTKVMRLQESVEAAEGTTTDLFTVLNGASRDYSVVAQKNASHDQLVSFNRAFSHDYGVTLHTLARRYDIQLEERFHQSEQRALIAEAKLQQSGAALVELRQSTSWKLTAPLRSVMNSLSRLKKKTFKSIERTVLTKLKNAVKTLIAFVVRKIVRFVSPRPNLEHTLVFLLHISGTYSLARTLYRRTHRKHISGSSVAIKVEDSELSPLGRSFLNLLKSELESVSEVSS